jgi:hypothetical protein
MLFVANTSFALQLVLQASMHKLHQTTNAKSKNVHGLQLTNVSLNKTHKYQREEK